MESNAVGVAGRKAVSSSAVDKLKKKKKKKRKSKEGKRSSASSNPTTGSPDSNGRRRLSKSRSIISCPPDITPPNSRRPNNDTKELCQTFNESLRWLPIITSYSYAFPPKTQNSKICCPALSRSDTNGMKETTEEEEERIAIYKMNRRKRYLAAQQAILDLYPDTKVYAAEDLSNVVDHRPAIFPTPPSTSRNHANNTPASYELAVPVLGTCAEKSTLAQKV